MRAHGYGRLAIVIGVAAAGVIALGAQTAAGPGVVKYDTKLDGRKKGDRWHTRYNGFVKSEVDKCERRRLVVLLQRRPGADRKVSTDLSKRDGHWLVYSGQGMRGHFYVVVRRASGNGYVCGADRAPNHGTWHVGA